MADANHSSPGNINPNIFPAKLWRLVNSPADGAIRWDSLGQVIVIDQQLFEARILSPASRTSNGADTFKTTNFSSFVRQLNLYGFKKVDPPVGHGDESANRLYHHFHNPNFQRSHPQLLENLVRLTVDNKAKLKAGRNIISRLPNRYQRLGFSPDDQDKALKGGCFLFRQTSHQSAAHPYPPAKSQTTRPQSGTPVPTRYLRRVSEAAFSPTSLPDVTEGQMPLRHHYSGVASGPNAVQVQQGFVPRLNDGNSHLNSFSPQNQLYQPVYYPTVCHCFHPNLVRSNTAGLRFPPKHYYQAEDPVTLFDPSSLSTESQEVKKPKVNLDVVFQIADEVMQTSQRACLVKVETTEQSASVPKPSSDQNDDIMCDNNSSTSLVRNEEELVVSVPKQMAKDAIYQVCFDRDKDAVEVSNSGQDSSQS